MISCCWGLIDTPTKSKQRYVQVKICKLGGNRCLLS